MDIHPPPPPISVLAPALNLLVRSSENNRRGEPKKGNQPVIFYLETVLGWDYFQTPETDKRRNISTKRLSAMHLFNDNYVSLMHNTERTRKYTPSLFLPCLQYQQYIWKRIKAAESLLKY